MKSISLSLYLDEQNIFSVVVGGGAIMAATPTRHLERRSDGV